MAGLPLVPIVPIFANGICFMTTLKNIDFPKILRNDHELKDMTKSNQANCFALIVFVAIHMIDTVKVDSRLYM